MSQPLKPVIWVASSLEDFQSDTYRAVYTVRLAGRIYVLHAFQKKARGGIKTSRHDIDLIRERFRQAQEIHREREMGTEETHE